MVFSSDEFLVVFCGYVKEVADVGTQIAVGVILPVWKERDRFRLAFIKHNFPKINPIIIDIQLDSLAGSRSYERLGQRLQGQAGSGGEI